MGLGVADPFLGNKKGEPSIEPRNDSSHYVYLSAQHEAKFIPLAKILKIDDITGPFIPDCIITITLSSKITLVMGKRCVYTILVCT